ncbi:hypothetical protein GLT92_01515 [Nanohaloarchaea archaeon]|nr:hypothetical protein [Candidatus Nanohaloarchaea archaeon]
MAWYALENIDEAIKESKDMLLPVDFMQLTKLALITFLIGGSGFNLPTGNYGGSPSSGSAGELGLEDSELTSDLGQDSIPDSEELSNAVTSMATASTSSIIFGVVLAIILFVGLPLLFLSSVFEFIFYRSLIDKEVRIRDYFSRNVGRGFRYFLFRLVYAAVVLLTIAAIAFLVIESSPAFLLLILALIPVFIVSSIFVSLTKDFILLRMMEENEALIEAWRSFWPTLKAEWKQILVYLFVKLFVGIVVGAVSLIAIIVFTVAVFVPVVISALLLALAAEVLALIPAILGIVFWIIGLFYIAVPFRVYIYYYVILVYHDLTE